MTIIAVANELGLHETALRRWLQRYGELGAVPVRRTSTAAMSGPSPADPAAENARLRRESARLGMERDMARERRRSSEGRGHPVRFGPLPMSVVGGGRSGRWAGSWG